VADPFDAFSDFISIPDIGSSTSIDYRLDQGVPTAPIWVIFPCVDMKAVDKTKEGIYASTYAYQVKLALEQAGIADKELRSCERTPLAAR